MKKEDLMKLEGMSEKLAKEIVALSAEELNGFVPKSRLDEVTEARKNAEAQLKERDAQLETLKKSTTDNEALQSQIKELQAENKRVRDESEQKIRKLQVDNAVTTALKEAGALNTKAAMALLADLDKAELAEDGSVKGLAEKIKALQTAEDSKFLFKAATQEPTKPAGLTPAGGTQQQAPSAGSAWDTKLAEARKNGDTLGAIAIKNQAAAEGVILM